MVFYSIKFYRVLIHSAFVLVFILIFGLMMHGCSSVSTIKKTAVKISRNITVADSGLKKKVGITFFQNRTLYKIPDFKEAFFQNLTEKIEEGCSNILLIKPDNADSADRLFNLPGLDLGEVDNFAMAETGRELGFNAIITGALVDISDREEKHGLLWYKDNFYYLHLYLMAEVYDTETGAKLFDESFIKEIEIDESELAMIKSTMEISIPSINDVLIEALDEMGERICDAVNSQPWKGFIVSVDADQVVISSGQRVGVSPGDTFNVYDNGKIVKGANSHRFIIPGLKKAEIKITSVAPEKAEAVIVSGKNVNKFTEKFRHVRVLRKRLLYNFVVQNRSVKKNQARAAYFNQRIPNNGIRKKV